MDAARQGTNPGIEPYVERNQSIVSGTFKFLMPLLRTGADHTHLALAFSRMHSSCEFAA